MQHSEIDIALEKNDALGPFGIDSLELLLSSDKGINYSSLKKTASGGELSRINLIIKNQYNVDS